MGQWKHRLDQLNPDTRTAVCSTCGPVTIKKRSSGGWRCGPGDRGYSKREVLGIKKYRLHLKSTCERCGFQPEDECQLDGHHRDYDRLNNKAENIQTLCANCHRLITKQDREAQKT